MKNLIGLVKIIHWKKIRTKKALAFRIEYKVLHASATSVDFTTNLCKVFFKRKKPEGQFWVS